MYLFQGLNDFCEAHPMLEYLRINHQTTDLLDKVGFNLNDLKCWNLHRLKVLIFLSSALKEGILYFFTTIIYLF